jgi:hypothetical protein
MMLNIRKIQEQIIFSAVKAASNDETATKIVYGEHEQSSSEDNATWGRGRRAVILLIVGFCAVLGTFFGNYIFSGLHSYQ